MISNVTYAVVHSHRLRLNEGIWHHGNLLMVNLYKSWPFNLIFFYLKQAFTCTTSDCLQNLRKRIQNKVVAGYACIEIPSLNIVCEFILNNVCRNQIICPEKNKTIISFSGTKRSSIFTMTYIIHFSVFYFLFVLTITHFNC